MAGLKRKGPTMIASSDVPPGALAPPVGFEARSWAISGPEHRAQQSAKRAQITPPFTSPMALERPPKTDADFIDSIGHAAAVLEIT